MDNESLKWNLTDVLVLRCINTCNAKGGDIEALISCGDYLDHSIFLFEELNKSLPKLLSANALSVKKTRFLFSKKFTKHLDEFKKPKKVITESQKFLEILNTNFPITEIAIEIDMNLLNKKLFDEALKVYKKF